MPICCCCGAPVRFDAINYNGSYVCACCAFQFKQDEGGEEKEGDNDQE